MKNTLNKLEKYHTYNLYLNSVVYTYICQSFFPEYPDQAFTPTSCPGYNPHHLQGFPLDPEEGHQSREENVGEEAEASKPDEKTTGPRKPHPRWIICLTCDSFVIYTNKCMYIYIYLQKIVVKRSFPIWAVCCIIVVK